MSSFKLILERLKRVPKSAVLAVLLLVAAVSAVRLMAPSTFSMDAGELSVKVVPALDGGKLIMPLGPIGELAWETHRGPVNLEASFLLSRNAESFPNVDSFSEIGMALVLNKLVWLFVFGIVAGLIIAINKRAVAKLKTVSLTLVFVLGTSSLVGMYAVRGFDSSALAHPSYRGPIQGAEQVIKILRESQDEDRYSELNGNINNVVIGLSRIYKQILQNPVIYSGDSDSEARFLVVSDVHSNPVGWMLAQELADTFKVDAVLDAGDSTSNGTGYDVRIFEEFAKFSDRPHIITPGNHEDEPALAEISKMDGVVLLDHGEAGDTIEIEGITILGKSDPLSRHSSTTPDNTIFGGLCAELLERFKQTEPHIILVHNPRLGECVADYAEENEIPLVFIWGHMHKQEFERRGSVVSVSPGTSGADGITAGNSYGFALVNMDKHTKKVSSVCTIEFANINKVRNTSCQMF